MSYRNKVACDCCDTEMLVDRAKGWVGVRIAFSAPKASNGTDGKSDVDEAPAPFKNYEHACPTCQSALKSAIDEVETRRRQESSPPQALLAERERELEMKRVVRLGDVT